MTTTALASELSDAEYALADQIEALLAGDVSRSWTPSGIARKVHANTSTASKVLAWMAVNRFLVADGNGAWTRYSARA